MRFWSPRWALNHKLLHWLRNAPIDPALLCVGAARSRTILMEKRAFSVGEGHAARRGVYYSGDCWPVVVATLERFVTSGVGDVARGETERLLEVLK